MSTSDRGIDGGISCLGTAPKQYCRRGRWLHRGVICLLIGAGLLVLLYPFYANVFSELQADGKIEAYRGLAASAEKREQMLSEARAYNEELAAGQIKLYDPFSPEGREHKQQYEQLLQLGDEGMMGIIRIPCVDIKLPIFHGTDAAVLEKGAGHLSGTSLPVGGESTHAVITGHTGLSSAKLFTDLIQMQEGDLVILEMLGEELVYQVTELSVVEPTDLSKLYIEPGKDLLTLVTCTPYGVNTHRLLVRAERADLIKENVLSDKLLAAGRTNDSEWMRQYRNSLLIGAGIIGLFLLIEKWIRHFSRKKQGD